MAGPAGGVQSLLRVLADERADVGGRRDDREVSAPGVVQDLGHEPAGEAAAGELVVRLSVGQRDLVAVEPVGQNGSEAGPRCSS